MTGIDQIAAQNPEIAEMVALPRRHRATSARRWR